MLHIKMKFINIKLDCLLDNTFKIKLKAIDLEDKFYSILYSFRPTIRYFQIFP